MFPVYRDNNVIIKGPYVLRSEHAEDRRCRYPTDLLQTCNIKSYHPPQCIPNVDFDMHVNVNFFFICLFQHQDPQISRKVVRKQS